MEWGGGGVEVVEWSEKKREIRVHAGECRVEALLRGKGTSGRMVGRGREGQERMGIQRFFRHNQTNILIVVVCMFVCGCLSIHPLRSRKVEPKSRWYRKERGRKKERKRRVHWNRVRKRVQGE